MSTIASITKVPTAIAMQEFGKKLALNLERPAVILLSGDVGTGKTTFTQGLAFGLGISEPITSPSFTISKRYAIPSGGELVHYDFYRLNDPGLMREDLAESIASPDSVTVIEWGQDVLDLVPSTAIRLRFSINDDESRTIEELAS